ncbi:MAG: PQQ-dependent sugar dehydrogenase [Planctomycetota bacterium]
MMRLRNLSVGLSALTAPFNLALAQGVEQLWTTNCINCHGERGQGGGAGTRTLLTDELFDAKHDRPFFDAIKGGLADKGMDAFGQTLKDEQVWGLVVYIRELQAREHRARVGSPKAVKGVYTSKHQDFRIETVVDKGLEVPWAVDFLPDGRMLVTDRPGPVRIHTTGKPGGKLGEPIEGTPEVRNRGQGGMMEVTVHPDYAKPGNGWIYLAFSDTDAKGAGMTKVVRGRLKEAGGKVSFVDQQTIFQARPEHYSGADHHFGSRIVFDPKDSGMLFFSIGERGAQQFAQDVTRPNGKVYRVRDDGTIPKDNPFVGKAKAYESVWSHGHRNPQGLVFDLQGRLWDTEHAPRGGDELNEVKRAANYGWPTICFGINYSGAPFQTPWQKPKAGEPELTMPALRWLPSIAACGLDVVKPGPAGEVFPNWKGDLMAGGLAGQIVERLRVKDGAVVEHEEIVHGMGRVRDVATGPDGSVYVVLNSPNKVIRLLPASK